MVLVKEIQNYKDYGRVVSISNGNITALVTVDLGPRIIFFGFEGGQNILCDERAKFDPKDDEEFQNFFGKGKKWENFGGHRIWISPEAYPDTYYPDDSTVSYTVTQNGAVFAPAPETENGVAKTLIVKMDPDDSNMQVIMGVKNISDYDKEFAVWGLSVAAKGGNLIIPMNDNDTGLLSNRIISVWPYTDMSDDRIYWGKNYVTVAQDTNAVTPIKLGFDLNKGNTYYVLGNDVFCKSFSTNHKSGTYPDGGCSFETYTNDVFIEVETLSELRTVKPEEGLTHIEHWSLCKKPCEVDFKNDFSIENFLRKI